MSLPKIIAIIGPTASGKTKLALHLAKKFNGEIISADSRQIYKGMDIGTSKATKKEREQIKHYLIDVQNPSQQYTVAQFKTDGINAIKKIIRKGKVPLLVGGTGLYISSIVNNLEIPKVKPNQRLRTKLEKDVKEKGLFYLFGKLTVLDPDASYAVDSKNPRRVIRALEVAMETGKPFTAQKSKGPKLFDTLILGLNPKAEALEKNIEKRLEAMIESGLVGEVRQLVKIYGQAPKAFHSIGYNEVIELLKGKIDLQQAMALIKKNTRRYAKRQMTWFRKMPVVWIRDQKEAERETEKFLRN
ncbi:MAG: tRNA (adenosine(37)-N6)-dimethylallyltransferase MiaA [bacterium]|nr:tRNA (adenosine(37)-N6)-dimethylallyltransferase MiaA [bacterium]